MAKNKFYVVWVGRISGVFDDWASCNKQVNGFPGAKYKAFPTKMMAHQALLDGYERHYKSSGQTFEQKPKPDFKFLSDQDEKPVMNSLSVDAACNMVTREMEYQGVRTDTREVVFHKGPFRGATNNIGEFLAMVHGLAYLQQIGSKIPIYTDSITAIAWVRDKQCKSLIFPTAENQVIIEMIHRAEEWLKSHTFKTPIIKWNTPKWGEIPADFGRK